jgi:hypothetical protein
MPFKPATKSQARARVALVGVSGSGKTYSALRIAAGLGSKVALIDTERGSASKYADEFSFDVLELESFDPRIYVKAIKEAEAEGYDVLIIDSMSHAWAGQDGVLDQVDRAAARTKGNKFAAWREGTPLQNALVDAVLRARMHVIATMRSKAEWVIEDEDGKKRPRKVGMAPVQRDQVEYEFDVVGDLDDAHRLIVTKTRCKALDRAVIEMPGEELGKQLAAWLSDGAPVAEAPEAPQPEAQTQAPVDPAEFGFDEPAESDRPEPLPADKTLAALRKDITDYFDRLRVPPELRLKTLERYKVDSVAKLTKANAVELRAKLARRVADSQGFGSGEPESNEEPDTEELDVSDDGIVEALERARDRLTEWEVGFVDSIAEKLQKYKKLTEGQRGKAVEVINRVRERAGKTASN